MAHAITYTEFGGPEVLTLTEIPDPQPGPGAIAIRVEAAGVNPIDGKIRSGARPTGPITEPRAIGSDLGGTVTAVGPEVDGFRVGDPVAAFGVRGAYATDVVVSASNAKLRPPNVSAAAAAGIGIPFGTAYQTLRSLGVRTDDTLLVHGGSGAVGQGIIQLARLWGATVVATASERRFDRVRELGATPVAYGDGLADRVRTAAPRGITVIIDAAGTDEALQTSIALLADKSRIATLVRGRDAAGLGIRAFGGGSPVPLTPQQQAWRAEAVPVVLALLGAGAFSIELGPSFALADAAQAHQAVQDGVDGKVVLVP
jgi:NADPH2:quinone reductase